MATGWQSAGLPRRGCIVDDEVDGIARGQFEASCHQDMFLTCPDMVGDMLLCLSPHFLRVLVAHFMAVCGDTAACVDSVPALPLCVGCDGDAAAGQARP